MVKKIISERIGIKISILKIADINISRDRGINVPNEILTTDANSVILDQSIDIIVELIGGTSIAKDLVEKSLSLGKPVVTANKALLAEFGDELFKIAYKYIRNVSIVSYEKMNYFKDKNTEHFTILNSYR